MANGKIIPISSQIVIISLFVILFSALFSLASAIYNNYQYDLKIKQFQSENERYSEENRLKMYDFLRASLRLVLEKERKETMNEINQGEQVIVLHTDTNNKGMFEQSITPKSSTAKDEELYKDLPNIQKWWHFFLD